MGGLAADSWCLFLSSAAAHKFLLFLSHSKTQANSMVDSGTLEAAGLARRVISSLEKKMKPKSVITKRQEKTGNGILGCKKREESQKKKIRKAGLMLLPQSASRGRCFRLGFLWLTQRCIRELKHEAETSAVGGAS